MSTFRQQQWLPAPLEEVFAFFSRAENLEELTPEWLQFEIVSPTPIEMDVGTLIDYRIRLRGLPMRWRTLIEEWDPPRSFVDRQLRGPYRQWIHTHRFSASDGGTLVEDEVSYRVPGGFLVDHLFVRSDIERIFAHRRDALRARFGQDHGARFERSAEGSLHVG